MQLVSAAVRASSPSVAEVGVDGVAVTAGSYREFLDRRRRLMAEIIRRYFDQL
jgi:hypothetical protein